MTAPDFVRVKDKATKHRYTVLAQEAEVNADLYEVLKQPAVDHNGDPLPGEIPETTTTGQSATTKKENN